MNSEFGRGCVYNLALFLIHKNRINNDLGVYGTIGKKEIAYNMWFYAAADHLFDMQIPTNIPKLTQSRMIEFRNKCLDFRLPTDNMNEATKKDYDWAIEEAKWLLRQIDKYCCKVKIQKGDYE